MRLRQLTMLVVCCLLPLIAAADTISLDEVIKTIETPFSVNTHAKTAAGIFDFQAEFFQESQIAAIDRSQHGQGEVSFKFVRGHNNQPPVTMFRWRYHQPTDQEIISDGRTLWVYQPDNRQVIETDISRAEAQQEQNPVTFLSGLGKLSRDFKINWGTPRVNDDGNYLLELQPRRVSPLIKTLQLVVAHKAVEAYVQNHSTGAIFPILATRVTDANGNRTTIEFRHIQVNPAFADSVFTFVRPKGVEVVRPTGEQLSN